MRIVPFEDSEMPELEGDMTSYEESEILDGTVTHRTVKVSDDWSDSRNDHTYHTPLTSIIK